MSLSAPQHAPPEPHQLERRASRRHAVLGWGAVVARVLTAAVFAVAGLAKAGDAAATVRAVRAYQLLPEAAVTPFAHALPWVELAVAALLLLGLATRFVAGLAALMLAAFIAAVVSVAARGIKIDCGCFGGGGAVIQTHYLREVLRDLVLLAVAALPVLTRPRLALDSLLTAPEGDPA